MIGFVVFSVKRALEGLRRNAAMTLAATVTMVLMLVMLAGLLVVLSGLQAGLQFVENKVEIQANLYDGVTPARVAALQDEVSRLPEVASVTYSSKDETLAEFREQQRAMGKEDLTVYTGKNPIPARLNVKLRDPRIFSDVVAVLKSERGVVREVLETQRVVDALIAVTGFLRTVGLIILVIVALTTLFIVVNTIRMAVMARADEIEVMRLVGASDAFIRWPFILEGLLVGLLGAAITIGLFALVAQPVNQLAASVLGQVPVGFDEHVPQQVAGVVLVVALALGGLGAWISVRAYLMR